MGGRKRRKYFLNIFNITNMDVKNLELTERDFQLLVEGLDTLPEKGLAGEMMTDLFVGMLKMDSDSNEISDFEKKRIAERAKKERDKESLKEDIKILQGKLLMFKRYLIQQDALKQVGEMLNY
jgi:hypothetical protein